MSEEKKTVGLRVRWSADVHAEVVRFSQGSASQAPTSLNKAVVFLIQAGLASIRKAEQESESGNWIPASSVEQAALSA